ncbi:MAG: hypothetical protein R2818_00840 [Flavobacteriales bacterium]
MVPIRLLFSSVCIALLGSAQALTPMPDANLRTWANNNFPGCIVGTSIDETHPGVIAATEIDLSFAGAVSNLMGTQVFVNAYSMNVSGNPITTWMGPAGLIQLQANNCGLTGTFYPPISIVHLTVSYNAITTLNLSNCANLSSVYAHHNQISAVVWGPNASLGSIDLSYNQLSTLGSNLYLPFLSSLNLSHNQFAAVPFGNNNLTSLNMSWNEVTDVSLLHGYDYNFFADLSHNQIAFVPDLSNAKNVDLSFNPLTGGMADTGTRLQTLRVSDTQLECLPYLHNALVTLYCTNSPLTCLPNQPAGLVMSAANFGFTPAVCTSTEPCYIAQPMLDLRVFLQGPYDPVAHQMNDDLRAQDLLPLSEPYTAIGFTYSGNGWPDVFDPAVLQVTGPDAIVDWIVVDMLLDPVSPGDAIHYSRPALVQRDGDVVALDGSWPLPLNTTHGKYRTAVRHRNHLGAIVKFGQLFRADTQQVDLSNYTATACFNGAMHGDSLLSNWRQLWSGDVTFDHVLRYTGTDNDRDPILQAIGGVVPTAVMTGVYAAEDVNMDGTIKYVGVLNDRDLILQNIGGSSPTAIRNQVGFQ